MKAWREQVAVPLAGQPVATFVLSMAFAAPLMDFANAGHNYIFELIGEPGIGKSTLQKLAASVVGPPTHHAAIPFVVSLTRLMDKGGGSLAEYRHLPLIVDHLPEYFAGATKAQCQQVLRMMVSNLVTGVVDGCDKSIRTIALLSSTAPLLSCVSFDSRDHRSLNGKVLTIPIPQRPHTAISNPTPATEQNQSFVRQVMSAAVDNHGTAFALFVKKLSRLMTKDPLRLATYIQNDICRFRTWLAVDQNDGAAVRIADAFGLVYAAGKLAQRYHCLPKNMDVLQAAQHCHGLHRGQALPSGSFIERLNELCKGPHVAYASEDSPEAVANADVIVAKCKGHSERWVRPDAIEVLFPDWQRLKNNPDVAKLRIRDTTKPTTTRKAGPQGQRVPMYVFRKPAARKESAPV